MSIRDLIEQADGYTARVKELDYQWAAGNLIPADELPALIAEAVAGEREKCAKAVCAECRGGGGPILINGAWSHYDPSTGGLTLCDAAAIRGGDNE